MDGNEDPSPLQAGWISFLLRRYSYETVRCFAFTAFVHADLFLLSCISRRKRRSQSPIRVLAIVNSFTHDTFEYLPQIAEAAGYDMEFAVLFIGGSQLSQHIENAKNDLPNFEYGYTQNGKWIRLNGYSIRQALEAGPGIISPSGSKPFWPPCRKLWTIFSR